MRAVWDGSLTDTRGLGNNIDDSDKSEEQGSKAGDGDESELWRCELCVPDGNIHGIESSKHGADGLPIRAERAEKVVMGLSSSVTAGVDEGDEGLGGAETLVEVEDLAVDDEEEGREATDAETHGEDLVEGAVDAGDGGSRGEGGSDGAV